MIYRILLIEGIFAFVFANMLFVNGVFLTNKRSIDPFILKGVFVILVLIAFLLSGILNFYSLAFLIIALTIGVRYLRSLKRKMLNSKYNHSNLNYYWNLYMKSFLKPVGNVYLLCAFATLFMYLANYFVLK